MTRTTCSFCGITHKCVPSAIGDAHICIVCVQRGKEVIGKIPPGSVACQKCGKFDHIVVTYKTGQAVFRSTTFDMFGVAVYLPKNATGTLSDNSKRTSACCGYCDAVIPLELLANSDYIW